MCFIEKNKDEFEVCVSLQINLVHKEQVISIDDYQQVIPIYLISQYYLAVYRFISLYIFLSVFLSIATCQQRVSYQTTKEVLQYYMFPQASFLNLDCCYSNATWYTIQQRSLELYSYKDCKLCMALPSQQSIYPSSHSSTASIDSSLSIYSSIYPFIHTRTFVCISG